jgi:hypothetical protein
MTRHVLTTVLAALAAVGVGAQGPAALQPNQRAELYRKNHVVIEKLVEKTVASSRSSGDAVKRAESYYGVLYEFTLAIDRAKAEKDSGRVADLTKNLNNLLSRGLKPTLISAQDMVRGGTGEAEYLDARDRLIAQVDALLNSPAVDLATKTALEQTRASLLTDVRKK